MARKKTKHRGVRVVQHRNRPGAKSNAQARWKDPRTGKQRAESLTGLTAEQRDARLAEIAADMAEAEALHAAARRRRDMGLPVESDLSLADAVARVLDQVEARRRERTVRELKRSTKLMLQWATERGIERADQVHRSDLDELRDWLQRRPRQRRSGGDDLDAPLSAVTLSRHVRGLWGVWRRIIARGWAAPGLTMEQVHDALENPATAPAPPGMLTATAYQSLFKAALKVGPQVAAFTVWVAVSGSRASEAINLEWEDVRLDPQQRSVLVRARKTDQPRLVNLRVSPGMLDVFTAMRRDDAAGRVWPEEPRQSDGWRMRNWNAKIIADGAEAFTWQKLRASCASWLACVDGIFGDTAQAMGLAQLGHTYQVARRHYLSHDRSLTQAASLDEAWKCKEVLAEIVAAFAGERGG